MKHNLVYEHSFSKTNPDIPVLNVSNEISNPVTHNYNQLVL